MKNIWRKFVLVLLAFLIVVGSMTLLTGCKEKKGATKPARESIEEFEYEELEESEEEVEDFSF